MWPETDPLSLMVITAHPDDETLGCGGTLARYSAEGVETYVLSATRGESGRHGTGDRPSSEELGRIRSRELEAAARELGVRGVRFLGYEDGSLSDADPIEAAGRIVRVLRQLRPDVVITFSPDGAYGHPDHIAISQLATGAVMCAADPSREDSGGGRTPHRVSKLYYMAWPAETWEIYQETFKTLTSTVDGVVRQAVPWPDWAITTRIDARSRWRQVWRAVRCHDTQMSIYRALSHLSVDRHEALWGNQCFYRVFSTVNGGRVVETDLFEGIRKTEPMEPKI